MNEINKTFALFLGCNIPAHLKQYEISARAVLQGLDITLMDISEFGCCGYPLRNIDRMAFVLSAARNLALAEKHGQDIMTLCQCGYGTLRMADHILSNEIGLHKEINKILLKEGLNYNRKIQIKHILSVLFHDAGVEKIRQKIERPIENLKVAAHYGCHVLRPGNIVQFDNPAEPVLFDRLIEATGAESINYPTKLDCCGAPLMGTNDMLALDLAEKKLEDASIGGAKYMVTACPFCQVQFENVKRRIEFERGENNIPKVILFTEFLEVCMGLGYKNVALEKYITPEIYSMAEGIDQ